MQAGFEKFFGPVTRTVTDLERDGVPMRKVGLARTYATTLDDLWEAVTDSERLARWFLPVTGDLKQGGRYQLKGNAGGEILECNPPEHLAVTWEFGGGKSWVELFLAEDASKGARLTLEHLCPVDEHWENFGAGAVGVGWDLALVGLDAHLDPDAPPMSEEALVTSDEGKAFIRGSSQDWARASIDAGAAPEAANAQARKTSAFYTGEAQGD